MDSIRSFVGLRSNDVRNSVTDAATGAIQLAHLSPIWQRAKQTNLQRRRRRSADICVLHQATRQHLIIATNSRDTRKLFTTARLDWYVALLQLKALTGTTTVSCVVKQVIYSYIGPRRTLQPARQKKRRIVLLFRKTNSHSISYEPTARSSRVQYRNIY